jgi:hypothetical protein
MPKLESTLPRQHAEAAWHQSCYYALWERHVMGFVVNVTDDESGSSRWIAPHTIIGVRRLASRDEAQVFPTHSHAEFEIEIFRNLLGDKFRFGIEPD